jgi:V-type H+-transporting ATPase subunit C
MNQLWFVSVPNRGQKADATHAEMQNLVATQNFCRIHRFEIPSLVVGTLDSLMALSDDLIKINTQIENVVRKIERQYLDVAGADAEVLRVANEMTVDNYLRNFQWDYARYRYQGRQLPDLVSQIQIMVAKVDDELKKLSVSYNEKLQTLSALQRKRTVNLVTSDFEDFLSAETVAKLEFLNTDYLQTLIVCVNSQTEKGLFIV